MTLRNRTVPLPGTAGDLPLGTVPGKRVVTLVFTDMEGSTPLLGALGDAFLPVLERQRGGRDTQASFVTRPRRSGSPSGRITSRSSSATFERR